MHRSLNRTLHWAGCLLAIAGVVFVMVRLSSYWSQIDFSRFSVTVWLVVGGFAVIYGGANLLLTAAWRSLLSALRIKMSWRWVMTVYGISQLAKYVPGNVFQFAGRQAMGMAEGMPGWILAKSMMWELCLLCIAGALYGILASPLLFHLLPKWLSLVFFILVVAVVGELLSIWKSKSVALAFVCYVGFLGISAGLFVGLVSIMAQSSPVAVVPTSWVLLGAAFVVAWLVGLMTPGAPAGVGVRELVLLFLLKGVVIENDLVFAVALGRLVTVAGDLIYFSLAVLIKRLGHVAKLQ